MKFIGENLLPGQLGHFFILLFLVGAALASVAYFLSQRAASETGKAQWKNLGRISFITQSLSVVAIFGLLFYRIMLSVNHITLY